MSENQQMKDFIKALLEEFYQDCTDIDGGTFQDLAEKHGILIPEIRHEPCGEFCTCGEMCSSEEWKGGVKCYRAAKWLSTPETSDSMSLFKFDTEIKWILGQPNFACFGIANALRKSGEQIENKSEAEQAAVIYWMLEMYQIHKDKWRERASEFLAQVSSRR